MDSEQGEWVSVTPPWQPSDQALEVLRRLSEIGKEGAIHKIFLEMWELPECDTDQLARQISEKQHVADEIGTEAYFAILACACCMHTFKAHEKGDWDLAWSSAMEASFWSGAAVGVNVLDDCTRSVIKGMKTRQAQHAAAHRHTENRKLKADALSWYQENKSRYPSKDAAAEAIAGKIVPVKFRTARDWLSKL